MRIDIAKKPDGSFELLIGQTKIRLNEMDLKRLAVAVTGALVPGAEVGKSADQRARDFVDRLKTVDDVSIQALLRTAEDPDVLVLLKIAEHDHLLADKLYSNMTDRSATVFREDLQFAFRQGLSEAELVRAIGRLMGVVERLEGEGRFAKA